MPGAPGEVSGRVLEAAAQDVTIELSRLGGEVVNALLAVRTEKYRFEKAVRGNYILAVRTLAASEQIDVEVRSNQRTEVDWAFEEEQPGSDGSPGHGDGFVAGEPTFAGLQPAALRRRRANCTTHRSRRISALPGLSPPRPRAAGAAVATPISPFLQNLVDSSYLAWYNIT